jgi:hypothetical protein
VALDVRMEVETTARLRLIRRYFAPLYSRWRGGASCTDLVHYGFNVHRQVKGPLSAAIPAPKSKVPALGFSYSTDIPLATIAIQWGYE